MSFVEWSSVAWKLLFPLIYTYKKMTYYVNKVDDEVVKPSSPVSIVVAAFNEEMFITETLKSLQNQNVFQVFPEMFEIIVVDDQSTDNTGEVAKQYTPHVISTNKKGKLNAKHAGIMYATNPIIVCCDADCHYPVNHLNLMLQHYYREDVIGVYGPFINVHGHSPTPSMAAWCGIIGGLKPPFGRFFGSNSSFLKQAYIESGGFNLHVDQFRRMVIGREEEVLFYHRLRTQGRIVYDIRLGVVHTTRYEFCVLGSLNRLSPAMRQYCRSIVEGERFK